MKCKRLLDFFLITRSLIILLSKRHYICRMKTDESDLPSCQLHVWGHAWFNLLLVSCCIIPFNGHWVSTHRAPEVEWVDEILGLADRINRIIILNARRTVQSMQDSATLLPLDYRPCTHTVRTSVDCAHSEKRRAATLVSVDSTVQECMPSYNSSASYAFLHSLIRGTKIPTLRKNAFCSINFLLLRHNGTTTRGKSYYDFIRVVHELSISANHISVRRVMPLGGHLNFKLAIFRQNYASWKHWTELFFGNSF